MDGSLLSDENLFFIGCIILGIIVLLAILSYLIIRWTQPASSDAGRPATITHCSMGKRGEMGNQIFQIATVVAAAIPSNAEVVLPERMKNEPVWQLFNLDHFPLENVRPDVRHLEYDNFQQLDIKADGKVHDIRGYRQNYQYFDQHSEKIRQLFVPKQEILDAVRTGLPEQYIAVHIRRGDYMKAMHHIPLLREFRRCQIDYYREAIRRIRVHYPSCPIFICTDSPKWAKTILPQIDAQAQLAPIPEGIKPMHSDFCTLYLADAVVMSNSTFSWWASYLNPQRPVVCPTPWWDPDGFVGTAIGLDGPYMHYPAWALLDADSGALVRRPYSKDGNRPDRGSDTLSVYRLFRGMIL